MIACGTGHRPDKLGGYTEEARVQLVRFAVTVLADNPRVDYVISGMAQGWDQALAEAAYLLDIPFTAAVPYPARVNEDGTEEGQCSSWPKEAQTRYWNLIEKAYGVVHVVPEPGHANWKLQKRNEWMIDASQWCFSLYNGDPAGGTANCVRYADRKMLDGRVVQLWEAWLAFNS